MTINKKTPQDLKDLFDIMGEDVAESHMLSQAYLKDLVEVIIGITETCEGRPENEDGMEQWKGFKCMRNGLRDLISKK